MRDRVGSGDGGLKTPSPWRRLVGLPVLVVVLTVGLVLAPWSSTPVLSIIVIVLIALLIPASSLERRGRVRWLCYALCSALCAAMALECRGSYTGLARTLIIAAFAIFAVLSPIYAIAAVVAGIRGLQRGGGQGRLPEPPAGNPGSLT
jgi:hypothetical protein